MEAHSTIILMVWWCKILGMEPCSGSTRVCWCRSRRRRSCDASRVSPTFAREVLWYLISCLRIHIEGASQGRYHSARQQQYSAYYCYIVLHTAAGRSSCTRYPGTSRERWFSKRGVCTCVLVYCPRHGLHWKRPQPLTRECTGGSVTSQHSSTESSQHPMTALTEP